MTVELPKDAEGREIPLDVEFLYNANGESVKPYSFTFRRYDGFCWEMHLVGVQYLVYDPKSFYLTPPDSWENAEVLNDYECGFEGYYVRCENCHSSSAIYDDKTDAIEAWNRMEW